MKCPKCDYDQDDSQPECQQCGVIFAKFFGAKKLVITPQASQVLEEEFDPDFDESPLQTLLWPQRPIGLLALGGKVLLLVFLLYLTFRFGFSSIKEGAASNSFFHLINLPFHEAGHIIFRPFGRIITSLGGTLAQLLMPIICLVALLFQTRDPFGAAACLWWLGENFLDIAPYIDDARSLSLPLIGGNFGYSSPYGFHDWEFILKELGLIRLDHFLARLSHLFGLALMLAALGWGVIVLYKGFSHPDS